ARHGQGVAGNQAPRQRLRRLLNSLGRKDPGGGLLADGEETMRARDECRALWRSVVRLERATRLEQLGGHDDVNVSRHGIEREDRLRGPSRERLRVYLEVVGGGARALGDSRNRGGLDWEPRVLGRTDDPLGQHTAALPSQRRDQNGDGTPG